MIYCDASLLVALLVKETHSSAADEWVRALPDTALVASNWTQLEVASALAQKLRRGELDQVSYHSARLQAAQMLTAFGWVSIEARHFTLAGERYVSAAPSGLRSGDALHLAIVADQGLIMATLDKQLAKASRQAGIEVASIIDH